MQNRRDLDNNSSSTSSSNGYRSDDSWSKTSKVDGLFESDVICERSRRATAHPGNQRYQALVRDWRTEYQSTKARHDKTAITRFIVQHVQSQGGRFVSFNKASCLWDELDSTAVHEKVTHALRSGSEEKKQQKRVYRKLRAASATKQRDEATATTAIFNFDTILQQHQQVHNTSTDVTEKDEDVLITKPINIVQVPGEVLFDTDVTPIDGINFDQLEVDHETLPPSQHMRHSSSLKQDNGTQSVYPSINDALLQSLDGCGVEIVKDLGELDTDHAEFDA